MQDRNHIFLRCGIPVVLLEWAIKEEIAFKCTTLLQDAAMEKEKVYV